MNKQTCSNILVIFFLLGLASVFAQDKAGYDPRKVFDPLFDSFPGTVYRSGSGIPGPKYW